MAEDNKDAKSGLIRVATNEYVLLADRAVKTIGVVVVAFLAQNINSGTEKLAADFNNYKLATTERIAKVEGQVGELKGSIVTHRSRLEAVDMTLANLWSRIYELAREKR